MSEFVLKDDLYKKIRKRTDDKLVSLDPKTRVNFLLWQYKKSLEKAKSLGLKTISLKEEEKGK